MRDFYSFHPAATGIYFLTVIAFSMVFNHPAFVAVCLAFSFLSAFRADRAGAAAMAGFSVPFGLFITFINPFFNRGGATVIFTYFGRNYTLEALGYGAVLAGIFLCGVNWFFCLGRYIDAEKIIYLSGGKFPNLCATLAAALGLFPFFTAKLREIYGANSLFAKKGRKAAFLSFRCAVAYAFEHAATMSFSMKNRGFGSGRRTRYRKYRFAPDDAALLAATVVLGAGVAAFSGRGATGAAFIPETVLPPAGAALTADFIFFVALCALPTVFYVAKEIKWHYLKSKI